MIMKARSNNILNGRSELGSKYILLDVLLCSIAEYFYELCRILTSPQGMIMKGRSKDILNGRSKL